MRYALCSLRFRFRPSALYLTAHCEFILSEVEGLLTAYRSRLTVHGYISGKTILKDVPPDWEHCSRFWT